MRQNGNILFLILLVVVLSAALSYAVTYSMRGGGKNASAEAMQSKVSAYIGYIQSIRSAIMRLQLVNDCKDAQISFQPGTDATCAPGAPYGNANSPTDCRCHVFHPNGGGVPYGVFADFGMGSGSVTFAAKSAIPNIGTSLGEILAVITKGTMSAGEFPAEGAAFCMAYNRISSDLAIDMNTPTTSVYNGPAFTGSFLDDHTAASKYSRAVSACHPYVSGGFLSYFVLLER